MFPVQGLHNLTSARPLKMMPRLSSLITPCCSSPCVSTALVERVIQLPNLGGDLPYFHAFEASFHECIPAVDQERHT